MPQVSNNPQSSGPSEPRQAKDSALTEQPKEAPTLTSIPVELRLQIYGHVLGPFKHTLRRQEVCGLRTETKLFDTSLLAVNKQTNAETVPIPYAIHTFHYGVSRRSSIPSHNLEWLKHASISVTTRTRGPVDIMLATQVQKLDSCCPVLRTLTLHIMQINFDECYGSVVEQLSPDGLTAKALRTLRPRLDRLSMVTLGDWACLEILRESVTTDDSPWVKEIPNAWPLVSLSCAPSLIRPALLRRGSLITRDYIGARMLQSIHAFHLFGPEIAKKLQEGKVEKRDWLLCRIEQGTATSC